MTEEVTPPDINLTAWEIAQAHISNPAVQALIEEETRQRQSMMASFGSWDNSLSSHFGLLAISHPREDGEHKPSKFNEISASILWHAFVNLADDKQVKNNTDKNSKAALNLFLGYLAAALTEKMKVDDWGGLHGSEVAYLYRESHKSSNTCDWLSKENKELFKELFSQAFKSWNRIRPWEKEAKRSPV